MKDSNIDEVKLVTRYFTICNPKQGEADGLLNCLATTLNRIGIKDVLDKKCARSARGTTAALLTVHTSASSC